MKTYKPNSVRSTRSKNNLHQAHIQSQNIGKPNKSKVSGRKKTKGLKQ